MPARSVNAPAAGKGRESLPGGSSSALSLGPGKGGSPSEIGDGSITFSASVR